MWRQSVPLGNAARATRRVCSGMGEGSCGCKDIGMLNAANQRGCSIFPQMQGIEFANSVNQYLMIDSTIVRAHQQAATGRKKGGPGPGFGAFPRRADDENPPALPWLGTA